MTDPRKPYLSVPGRWKVIRLVLVVLGFIGAILVAPRIVPRLSHGAIALFVAWIALVLWADVWMFGIRARAYAPAYLVRVAVLWSIVTVLTILALLILQL